MRQRSIQSTLNLAASSQQSAIAHVSSAARSGGLRDWYDSSAAKAEHTAELEAVQPGQWVAPPQFAPHSGGSRGGRPPTCNSRNLRGMRGGFKTNRRQCGQSVLRRDISVAQKLAVVNRLETHVTHFGSLSEVSQVLKREEEEWSGFSWKVLTSWFQQKSQLQADFRKLRVGVWGLNPIGCSMPLLSRKSISQGKRVQRVKKDTYQSAVLRKLQHWFESQRNAGISVYSVVVRDRYMKCLEQAIVEQKCKLLELQSEIEQAKSRGFEFLPVDLLEYEKQLQE